MGYLKKLLSGTSSCLDWTVSRIVFVLITLMIIVTCSQIIFRVFFMALTWSEELTRYLLVWSTFLGATMAYKRAQHISITFLIDLLPEKIKVVVTSFTSVIIISFFMIITYHAMQMIKIMSLQTSPALSIQMKYVYLIIPVSLTIMAIHALNGMFDIPESSKRG